MATNQNVILLTPENICENDNDTNTTGYRFARIITLVEKNINWA